MARQRGNRWQADVMINGVRKRVSFGTREEAETYERLAAQGLAPTSATTFQAFAEEQFERIWGENRSVDDIKGGLRVLYRYIDPETPIPQLNTRRIDQFITDMKSHGAANGTINRKLAVLSKLLKRARKLELITSVPHIERLREGKGRERVWTKEDEHKAFTFLQHHGLFEAEALIRFLLYTGCRLGDAYKLDRSDVTGRMITFRDTKNGETRTIPMVPNAETAWRQICSLSRLDRPFGEIPRGTFRGHWARLREHFDAIDDPDFVPHMLRHTCATRLVLAGVDLPRVMKWMGHKSIQVTMRYSHLAPKDLDLAAEALS